LAQAVGSLAREPADFLARDAGMCTLQDSQAAPKQGAKLVAAFAWSRVRTLAHS
jgi:hypothetical protein